MARYKMTIIFDLHEEFAGDHDKVIESYGPLMQVELINDIDKAIGINKGNDLENLCPMTYEIISCEKIEEV